MIIHFVFSFRPTKKLVQFGKSGRLFVWLVLTYYSVNIMPFLLLKVVKSVGTLQLEYQLCQIHQFILLD